jgi:DNA-directed RNA polymerase subunit H (RpoH/RPB5)
MNNKLLDKDKLYKIFLTLFEKDFGLFYRRQYINNGNAQITYKDTKNTINEMLELTYDYSGIINNIENSKEDNLITVNTTNEKYFINFVNIRDFKKNYKNSETNKDKNPFLIPENTIIIIVDIKLLPEQLKTMYNLFYYKDLLFNLTKHKFVPHIEITRNDVEVSKIAKIKYTDKLIKFYGFPIGSVCKIVHKAKKINNIDIYSNYKTVIE